MNRINLSLANLAGGRTDVLSKVPGATTKFGALGTAMLATALVAVCSGAFFGSIALHAPPWAAVLIGLGWGGVILAIDRALVVSMGPQHGQRSSLGIAVPRLVMAVVIGAVVSTPMTLLIFDREIRTEVSTIQREAAAQFREDLEHDPRFIELPALEVRVRELKGVVASGGASDPEVQKQRANYDAAQAKYLELQAAAQCELNGNCGTGREGVGAAYESARTAADAQRVVAEQARRELDAAAAKSSTQAETDLAGAQRRYDALLADRTAEQQAFDAKNADGDGMLIRLHALHRLSTQDLVMGGFHALIFLLLLFIEIMPVVVKLMLRNVSAAYERAATAMDDGAAAAVEGETTTWTALQLELAAKRKQLELDRFDVAHGRDRMQLDLAADLVERERAQGLLINEKAADEQRKVVEAYLEAWARQVQAQLAAGLAAYERDLLANQPTTPQPVIVHQRPPQHHGRRRNGVPVMAQLPDDDLL